MRELAVDRRLPWLRCVAVVLLAATLAVGGCAPRLGGANAAAEGGLPGESDGAAGSVGPPAPEPAGGPVGAAAGSPGEESATLSRFGLLTPLFPGLSSGAATACEPDDFYGGCL